MDGEQCAAAADFHEVGQGKAVQTAVVEHYENHDDGGGEHTIPYKGYLCQRNHPAEYARATSDEDAYMQAEVGVIFCCIHKYYSLLIMFKICRGYREKEYFCTRKR